MKTDSVGASTQADAFAGSLVELAKGSEGLDAVDRDLRLVKETITSHMDLKKTLTDAGVDSARKQAVLGELFADKLTNTTLQFLQMMVGLNRFDLVLEIGDAFASRLEAAENKMIAEVTTAVPIEADFSDRLAKRLSEMVGREVAIRTRVDADLIGGIIVRIGGKLVDASVRNQLSRMREQMLQDMRGN